MSGLYRQPPYPHQRSRLPPATPAALSCVLVVADKTSLTATDTDIQTRLLGLGYALTIMSDEDAIPSMTGVALVVICESVVSATLGAKYSNVAVPLICFDNTPSVNMDLMTGGPNVAGQTQVEVLDPTHPAANGLSGTQTVFSSAVTLRYSDVVAASARKYLNVVGDTTHWVGFTYEAGDTLLNAHVAEAKRAVLFLFVDAYLQAYNATALGLFDALVAWTQSAPVAPPPLRFIVQGAPRRRVRTAAAPQVSVVGLPVGNPVAASAADSLAAADSVARTGTFLRTVAGALGLGDAVVGSRTYARSAADSLGLADAIARAGSFLRSLADSTGLANVVARAGGFMRSIPDAIAAGDSVSRTLAAGRTAGDTVSLGDVVARAIAGVRSVTDVIASSDTAVRAGSFLRTVADGLTLASVVDAVKSGGTIARSAADSLGLGDAVSRTGTFLRSSGDGLTLGNAVSRVVALPRTVADAIATSTSVARVLGAARTAADAVATTSTASRIGSFVRAAADGLGLADTIARSIGTLSSGIRGPVGRARNLRPGGSAANPRADSGAEDPRPDGTGSA